MNDITYTVKLGDTLYNIAKKFNTTVKQLMELNNLNNTLLNVGQILHISKVDNNKNDSTENYEDFLKNNIGRGTLKIHTLIGNTFFPVQDVKVEVYKMFGDEKKVFFSGTTSDSGMIDDIILPTMSRRDDYLNGAVKYQISVKSDNYDSEDVMDVYIYDGIKSIQKIEMTPIEYVKFKDEANGK